MSTTIKRTDNPKENPFEISEKRLRLPFMITATCPHCGQTIAKDYADDYFAYPVLGVPLKLGFYHQYEGPNEVYEEHEFSIQVILDVTLTIVQDTGASDE